MNTRIYELMDGFNEKPEGRHGIYALIDKNEKNKEMKQSRPFVRAQLQTEKSPKVPKKTVKSKNHELEV